MIYVALLEGVAIIATALTFAGVVRWLIREHARERNLMLNQIMHLAGRTWEPAPSEQSVPEEPLSAYDFSDEAELLDPAQLPVDYS